MSQPISSSSQVESDSLMPPASASASSSASSCSSSSSSTSISNPLKSPPHHNPRRSVFSPNHSPNSFSIDHPRPTRLYFAEEFRVLAEEIYSLFPDRIELGKIQFKRFADGFPNLFVEGWDEIKYYHVAFLTSFHSPEMIFEQYAIASALPKALPRSYKLILPFFPTGTMERVETPGMIATANTLARILSTIPSCAKGPAQVAIYDLHTLQNQFYFQDSVLVRLGSCIPLLIKRIDQICRESQDENFNVAFPDDGAHKRFGGKFSGRFPNPCVCHKIRDGEKRVVKLKEGDVKDKHVLIIDDLVQSGGTLIECAKELLANGARLVSAYVTHAVFPNDSWTKFIPESADRPSLLKYFFVTNTNPQVAAKLTGVKPFEVLSIGPLVSDIITDGVSFA